MRVLFSLVQKLLEEGNWIEILTKPANMEWPAFYASPVLQPFSAETTVIAALQPQPQRGSHFTQEWHFRKRGKGPSQLLNDERHVRKTSDLMDTILLFGVFWTSQMSMTLLKAGRCGWRQNPPVEVTTGACIEFSYQLYDQWGPKS